MPYRFLSRVRDCGVVCHRLKRCFVGCDVSSYRQYKYILRSQLAMALKQYTNVVPEQGPQVLAKYAKKIHYGDKYYLHVYQNQDVTISEESNLQLEEQVQSILSEEGSLTEEKELFEKCRGRLKNDYQTYNAYMRSLFWDNKRRDFPLKDYYVDLKLQETDYLGNAIGDIVNVNDIFQEISGGHRNILVFGDPGYGKSTLCKKIAYDWAIDNPALSYLSHFDFVIALTLRELQGKSVMDAALEAICKNEDVEVKKRIWKANLNILIILDGYDEIMDKSSILQFITNDSFDISRKMTILVTSRPHAAEEIREVINSRFLLKGFLPEEQEKYIKLVLNQLQYEIHDLQSIVEGNYFSSTLSKCPLMLHLLCCLHKNDSLENIERKTDLYICILQLLIKRFMKKNGECMHLKKGKYFYGEDLLVRLGKLFYEKNIYTELEFRRLFEKKRRITFDDLKEFFPHEEEIKFILGLELLVQCFDNDIEYFDDLHKSFKEFLIALYLYKNTEVLFWQSAHDYSSVIPEDNKVNYYIITFYVGLYESDKIPEYCLNYFTKLVFPLQNAVEIYKEIKNENNKIILSKKMKKFFLGFKRFHDEVLPYTFSQLYCVIGSYRDCNSYRRLVETFRRLQRLIKPSHQLEIFMFLDVKPHDLLPSRPWGINQCNGQMEIIRDSIINHEWKKLKIYFCGVVYVEKINVFNPFLLSTGVNAFPWYSVKFFRCVENPAQIPTEVREEIRLWDMDLIALKFFVKDNNCRSLLIRKDLFDSLQPYIKIFPEL
ncbi:NACHT, LRR and PYD domains-containing protein 10-like isoform X2 [Centruroides vittatus]|uniref:NACHT, LRR and PYD domains-containing protein 10-like isoform X2 n=1 Tax=Centruroides vittatus TaxID=120091 RepID=UPI00350F4EC4